KNRFHMKKSFLIMIGLMPGLCYRLFAQSPTPEDVYKKPLQEVLKQVEQQYHVKLEYEPKNVQGLTVTYATWRFKRDFAETMDNILKPLDLVYNAKGKDSYEVTKYEYFRRTEAEGAYHLQQLLTLYHNAAGFDERRRELRACI